LELSMSFCSTNRPQFILILIKLVTFLTKQATLLRRSTVISLPHIKFSLEKDFVSFG
jgi:hypothetical protein